MATIVLVPGACLGAWAWSRATPLLQEAGHDVRPVTLTGLGRDEPAAAARADLSTHVADLVDLLERDDLRDVVLVGHSFSGLAISGAAAAAPERIARLVYLDATLPVDGRSAFDAAGPEFEQAILAAVAAGGDPDRVPWFADEQLDAYYAGHELTAADREWIRAETPGHPLATFREPLDGVEAAGGVERTYVTCLRRAFPSPIGDDTPGWEHATLDAGHWPMISRPRETAALLDALARAR
ncbi:alpha/beta fold hydrolase [Conexibacter arvalis]|uniref:Pimeloyl-ACP methyl ester carboxylesterase n=1 Tax=Conexibacter arvalis TaxID=912552 RepID=A0A840IGT6_9ACTN|nr:alpha/beta fold hydrolase [Conexibacter arvalis]MBB4663545.1 pimeloyl-ACP methyl ester carboxylesterase [Conexibacter arvalis]